MCNLCEVKFMVIHCVQGQQGQLDHIPSFRVNIQYCCETFIGIKYFTDILSSSICKLTTKVGYTMGRLITGAKKI